jgi:peptidoglycan hydrolase-like protein with peptidoglycan-binding domain
MFYTNTCSWSRDLRSHAESGLSMRVRAICALPVVLAAAFFAPDAAGGDPGVAALQVGLQARGFYEGPIDGINGPGTAKAVRRLQKRARITVDGVPGPQTRRALGHFGRHSLGSRPLKRGNSGWDVASLQFRLAEHGFPSGEFDGIFGPRLEAALRRFQEWSTLAPDGVAGPATLYALTGPLPSIPLPLAWPLTAPVLGDPFGPRGNSWHAGIDLPAPLGTSVYSARSGQVVWAGWRDGWGLLVTVAHGRGERTMYAHLSRVDVRVGVWVAQGVRVGRVGATGHATGPHLHFEVRIRNASVDPLRALPRSGLT